MICQLHRHLFARRSLQCLSLSRFPQEELNENNRPHRRNDLDFDNRGTYRIINQLTNERLGGLNSAKILLYSLNFEEFKPPSDPDSWGPVAATFTGIARRLQSAGADCLLLCANTPHMAADTVQKNIGIPLLHIAEVTAKEYTESNNSTVAMPGKEGTGTTPVVSTPAIIENSEMWQGAYVFKVDSSSRLHTSGHSDEPQRDGCLDNDGFINENSGFFYSYDNQNDQITRTLYIGNTLYTVSNQPS